MNKKSDSVFGAAAQITKDYIATMPKEPENCKKEWSDACECCEYKNFIMVGHPGGSRLHSTEQYYCEFGCQKRPKCLLTGLPDVAFRPNCTNLLFTARKLLEKRD